MRGMLRLALALVLRVARASLDAVELDEPHPDGPPRAHAPGSDSSRILIVGNGPARGLGVRSHDLALPGALARAVSSRTGRGVDVDLTAERRLSLERIPDAVRASHLTRYESLVVVSGGDEALGLLPLATWRTRLTSVLAELRGLIGPTATIVVTGVPANHRFRGLPAWIARLADTHAACLDRVTLEVCRSAPNARFVALASTGPMSPTHLADDFAHWAQLIAVEVARDLSVNDAADTESALDELRRQAAVDRLGLSDSGTDLRLRAIVDLARRVFGADTALFTVLDRDLHLHAARSGTDLPRIARSNSFCHFTILERDGLTVEDARTDGRFRLNPLVTRNPHIRFYAGFPVNSPDGERVGTLCVFDSSPRRIEDVNTSLLRELAHLVERELWRYLPVTAAPRPSVQRLARSWTSPRLAAVTARVEVGADGA